MATTADADIVLKLYTLRTEELMRKARRWVAVEFQPETYEELTAVHKDFGSERNAFYRQVMSYWEMTASFVLRGAVDPDLFLDSASEGIFLAAKFDRFQDEHQRKTGGRMMAKTGKMIEQFPAARVKFEGALKAVEAQRPKK